MYVALLNDVVSFSSDQWCSVTVGPGGIGMDVDDAGVTMAVQRWYYDEGDHEFANGTVSVEILR